jgi:hypothetical protein
MIRKLAPILVVVAIAMMSFGCGDDTVCENFDVPVVASQCAESSDCSEVDCEAACSSGLSDANGSAFCENQTCQCPCRACVDVPRF